MIRRDLLLAKCRGSASLLGLLAVLLLSALGIAFLSMGMASLASAKRDYLRCRALAVADAGVERAICFLRGTAPDLSTDGTWRNHGSSDPNDHSADAWYEETLKDTPGERESFKLCVRTAAGADPNCIVVTSISTVTYGSATASRKVVAVLERKEENVCAWNNVIFAGVGQAGHSINGNVIMRGSVHLLGDGEPFTDIDADGQWDDNEPYTDVDHNGQYDLGEPFTDVDGDGQRDAREPFTDINGNGTRDPALTVTDLAEEVSGTADVGNNYSGMSGTLASKIPAPPTVLFGGENVESLSARLRVKHGLVGISGSASVGWENVAHNSIKETMDGCHVNDGYTGTKGSSAVYSDNGASNKYDLGDGLVKFPSLSDPYQGYPSYKSYLQANSLNIDGALSIGATSFSQSGPNGSVSYDSTTKLLQVSGIVYVNGDINLSTSIVYSGKGTLVSTGDIAIEGNLLPMTKFPTTDSMGLIAARNMTIGSSAQLTVSGAFYAQYQIYIPKQTELAGTCVSSYFSVKNVPHLFQVPALTKNLPPGMPGADPIWIISIEVKSWQDESGSSN